MHKVALGAFGLPGEAELQPTHLTSINLLVISSKVCIFSTYCDPTDPLKKPFLLTLTLFTTVILFS